MPAYLLRYAGTNHFAGFYAADSQDHLFFSSTRRPIPTTTSTP